MAIAQGLRTLLLSESTITSLLASTSSVYLDAITQNHEMSYLSVTLLNQDPMMTLGGTTGMRSSDVDIDCVCTSRLKSDALADAVDDFIKDYTGTAGSHTINAVTGVGRAYDVVEIGQGTDTHKYVTTVNIEVQHDG